MNTVSLLSCLSTRLTIERVDALRAVVSLISFPFPSKSQFSLSVQYWTYASRAYTSTPLSMEVMSIVDATAEPCRSSRARFLHEGVVLLLRVHDYSIIFVFTHALSRFVLNAILFGS